MLPLLIYLILKWHEIQEVCAETGIVIEYDRFKESKITFRPKKTFHRNNVDNKVSLDECFLQENSTQTEIFNCFSKFCQTPLPYQVNFMPQTMIKLVHRSVQTDIVMKMNRTSQTAVQNLVDNSPNSDYELSKMNITETFPMANSTAILTQGNMNETSQNTNKDEYSYFTAQDLTSKYYSIVNESLENNAISENRAESVIEDFIPRGNESEFLDRTPYSFFSAIDTGYEWDDIVKETSNTVRKMEEYIYDDYDTFAKEEFNQLFDESKY